MRVVSYNIHKGIGGTDRRYHLSRIIDVLQAEEADLICLQEVDINVHRTRFDNQPEILAEKLQANAALFQLNHPRHQGGYGNLILSRWRFVQQDQVSIRHLARKNRGAQMVVVETPQGRLHLVNWHLGLREHERRWQARHLLEHPQFQSGGALPTLIVGDYNDWRNTLDKHCFRERNFTQVTAPPGRYRSFPAFLPLASLDKAYTRGAIEIAQVAVTRNKHTRRASDHLPLVVDFHLQSASTV